MFCCVCDNMFILVFVTYAGVASRYTHDRSRKHAPAMAKLMSQFPNKPDLGFWHETYTVKPGQHESIYVNCPPIGLGAAAGRVPAEGHLKSSRGRMKSSN